MPKTQIAIDLGDVDFGTKAAWLSELCIQLPAARKHIETKLQSYSTPGTVELVNPKDLRSMPELGKLFKMNADHLRDLAANGKFPAWYVGGSWLSTVEFANSYVSIPQTRGRPRKNKTQK